MSKEKIISTAKKLQALATQGEGGEAVNAKAQLESLFNAYNWLVDALNDDESESEYELKMKDERCQKLVIQLAAFHELQCYAFALKKYKMHRVVKGKKSKVELFKAQYPIHERAYLKELKAIEERHKKEAEIVQSAYIQVNKLFRPTNNDAINDDYKLTDDDYEIIKAASKMKRTEIFHQLKK